MAVESLQTDTSIFVTCPAFVEDEHGLPVQCGQRLNVVVTNNLIGDDYGSWRQYSVEFQCGHSLEDMENGLRYADQI